jgi:hypothetical protein
MLSGPAAMVLMAPVVLGLAGPLLARSMKLPTSSAFVLPGCVAGLVACPNLEAFDSRRTAFAAVGVLLALYVLLALAVTRRPAHR